MKQLVLLVCTFIYTIYAFQNSESKKQKLVEKRAEFEKIIKSGMIYGDDTLVPEADKNTVANFKNARIINYDLDLELDFEQKDIIGTVKIQVETFEDLVSFQLDSWNINVTDNPIIEILDPYEIPQTLKVNDGFQYEDTKEVNHNFGGVIEFSQFKVKQYVVDKDGKPTTDIATVNFIPKDEEFYITIKFITENDEDNDTPVRYDFVDAEYTHSGDYPFFYTQNSPVYARTVFPCWDTPQSKTTMSLTVSVKESLGLSVYSSVPKDKTVSKNGYSVTYFTIDIPQISTHQLAIVAGHLEEKQIYKDSTRELVVVADTKDVLNKAADELKDLNLWITSIEQLLNLKFAWERFEVMIMPPNYPYEGNQQYQLTYVAPSAVDSGRAGVAVVFHEIANAYFGNYVQACNWQNVWLNEGISTYVERVTKELYYGDYYSDLDRIVGNFTLAVTFDMIDQDKMDASYKSLHPNTYKTNPDDAITEVPYEKGYQFIAYLAQEIYPEQTLKLLSDFLKDYRFKTVDYVIFQSFVQAWLNKNFGDDGATIYKNIDWDAWIKGTTFPPKTQLKDFQSDEFDEAVSLANKFLQFDGTSRPNDYKVLLDWNNDMVYAFLDFFQRHSYMINKRLIKQLDETYDFKNFIDVEIKSRWYVMSSMHKYNTIENQEELAEFLSTVGRIKYVVPVYEALHLSGQTSYADMLLLDNLEFYHPVALEAKEAAIFRVS